MERVNPFRTSQSGTRTAAKAPPLSAARHTPTSRVEERVWDQDGALNPLRQAGRRTAAGSNTAESKDRMFDKSGQVNAYDNGDVLRQIAHLLKNVAPGASGQLFRSAAKARETNAERTARMSIVAQALRDPTGEGFAIVGQELLLPIKDQRLAS